MSNQPSEAALEAAKEVIITIQESYGIEYKGGEPVDNSDWHYWANTLDAFAAQAVAAERARVVEELEAQKAFAFRRANAAHERGNLREELIQSAARSAYAKAIEIVNREQKE